MDNNLINIPYWNRKDLIAPTMISRPLTCQNSAESSAKLSNILKKMLTSLAEMSSFDVDAALISRLIFRMKRVFRHDKILQGMQKINRCLTSILEVNVLAILKELDDCTYENNGPTKEMVQWAMLSLQRYAALLQIVITRCASTVPFLNNKLSTGHHWNIATILLGVIGRIWILSRHMRKKSCIWYKQLRRFLTKTLETGEHSSLGTYIFPRDLEVWLENLSDSHQSMHQNILNVNKEAAKPVDAEEVNEEVTQSAMYFKEDLGEVISRDSINDNVKSEKIQKKKPFTCFADLFKFIEREKRLRKKDITAAETKNLDSKHWNRLYTALTGLLRQLHCLTEQEHQRKQDILHKANLELANFVKV